MGRKSNIGIDIVCIIILRCASIYSAVLAINSTHLGASVYVVGVFLYFMASGASECVGETAPQAQAPNANNAFSFIGNANFRYVRQ